MAGPITAQVKTKTGSFIRYGKNYFTYIQHNTKNVIHIYNPKTGEVRKRTSD